VQNEKGKTNGNETALSISGHFDFCNLHSALTKNLGDA
jgi:hypothetical protein